MPNPNGNNSFDRFGTEKPYGEVKKMKALQGSAPMSGAPTPAITTPQRAQEKAVRGPVSAPKPQKAPSGGVPPYEVEVPQTWQEIAAQPGASEWVRRFARRALGT